ncbi:hypothetical protein KSP40_PGU008367 [Platanthera guangdongensis]|uniref:Uncharacterized protein n=1 Tax=Platanthera guangdongensis TaxID=2320717 RepID=A0ABR2MWR5_9ASPA
MTKQNPVASLQKTMSYYARLNLDDTKSSIFRPTIANNNFEIKYSTIQMIQNSVLFDGLLDEDTNTPSVKFSRNMQHF